MRSCRFVLLALLVGCGEGAATPPRGPAPELAAAPQIARGAAAAPPLDPAGPLGPSAPAAAPAPAPGPTPTPALGTVGHLEGAERLARLFEAFAKLDQGHAHDDVRILQYGDSHTASDAGVLVFRHALQARFGDGGRGFVSLGRPWKTYWAEGVHGGMTKEFEPVRTSLRPATVSDTGYGLLGIGIAASVPGARAWADVGALASRIELDYGQHSRGGSFDVFIDGVRAGRVATRAAQPAPGYSAFEVADAPHSVEIRVVGDGDVRVYGMALDRAQAGVVVDTLGINGAQVFTPLGWSEQHFADQLRHRAADLVVLAYGTNEALDTDLTDSEYERALVELLGRVARAAPTASCLLLGPPDLARQARGGEWKTLPRIAEIVAAQRRIAQAAGCGFFDQMAAMGGPGTIAAWAEEPEPRAARDRVHMKRSGYAQLATAFADDLMRAYDEWRAARGLSPTSAPHTWGLAAR